MSDISQLAIWMGERRGVGKQLSISPYYYTSWLRERGQGGELSSLPSTRRRLKRLFSIGGINEAEG
jgi:hypothetical protein